MVPYVDAVTVRSVLLFVLHESMLRECEGDDRERCTCEYMGGTRGSNCMYTVDDVLEMSVVCWVRGVCRMCGMCMYLAWGRMCGGERIGFGIYQSCRNRRSV